MNINILCGLPGAGKTTFANTLFSDNIIISYDEILSKISNIVEARDEMIKMIINCCKQEKDCVIDALNLSRSGRKFIISHVKKYNPFIRIIYIETPLECCKERRKILKIFLIIL